jgi:hypothetical protein
VVTSHRVDLTLIGHHAIVRCASVDSAERVAVEWARCLSRRKATGDWLPIDVSGPESFDADEGGYVLASTLTSRVIERLVGTRMMFHACGLSTDDGRVLALVAASGTGKTTAARMLAASAFGYVTDETVVIDDELRVEAYPKPLSLLGEVNHHQGKVQRGPDELGLRACADELRLGPVVMLDRGPDGLSARLEPVTLLDAMLEVIPQTSGLPSLARPLQRLAEAILAGGGGRRLTYSEIAQAEPLLRELMAEPTSPPSEGWEAIEPLAGVVPLRDGRLGVDAYQDAIIVDDELLLLVHGVPMRLSGIGASIWLALRSGVASADLTHHVTDLHGEHPQAVELVDRAVADLLAAGAISRRAPQPLAEVLAGKSSDSAAPFA